MMTTARQGMVPEAILGKLYESLEKPEGSDTLGHLKGIAHEYCGLTLTIIGRNVGPLDTDKPPESAEHAIIYRHLALNPRYEFNNKVEWQRYWLKCLLNPRCDYIFSILETVGIRREGDVEKYIAEDNESALKMWEFIPKGGRNHYRKAIAGFFLRRLGLRRAVKASNRLPLRSKLDLFYPRLLVGIVIGFLPFIPEQQLWQLPHNLGRDMPSWSVVSIALLVLAAILMYLYFECRKSVEEEVTVFWRALGLFLYGLTCGTVLSIFLCIIMGTTYLEEYGFGFCSWFQLSTCLPNIFFLAPLSLLFGIVIQFFWEDKSISEPL